MHTTLPTHHIIPPLHIKNLIPPPPRRLLLHHLTRSPALLLPNLNHAARGINPSKHIPPLLRPTLDAHAHIQIWIIGRRETRDDGAHKRHNVVWGRNARGAQTLARKEQLAVGGVEELADAGGELVFEGFAEDGTEEGFEKPRMGVSLVLGVGGLII
jgi:hypothetical protein